MHPVMPEGLTLPTPTLRSPLVYGLTRERERCRLDSWKPDCAENSPLTGTAEAGQSADGSAVYLSVADASKGTVEAIPLTPTVGVSYNYSPEYNGQDDSSNYVLGTLDLVLPAEIGLSFGFGRLDVSGGTLGALVGRPNGFAFTHYRVGASKVIQGFTFDLTYHDTSSDCEDEYGDPYFGATSVCTPGAVFTLSRTF